MELSEKVVVCLAPSCKQSLAAGRLAAVLVSTLGEFPGVVSLAARLQPAEDDARDADGRGANRYG
jgi:hypothetical protein